MTKEKSVFFDLHHVGWVVRDINKSIEYFEALGIGPWERYRMPSPGHEFTTREHFGASGDPIVYEVATAQMGPIQIEMFECISGDSIPKRFLDSKGEGIWHFGYNVEPEDFDKAIAEMTRKGFKVVGSSTGKKGTRMVFFDTDKLGGVIFQLHDSEDFF